MAIKFSKEVVDALNTLFGTQGSSMHQGLGDFLKQAGADGNIVYVSPGAPSTLANDGDIYINQTNGDLYKQANEAWGVPLLNLKGATGDPGILRAGSAALGSGATFASVAFSSALSAGTYVIMVSISNTTDVSPLAIQAIISAQSLSGFSVKLPTATDSANYTLNYTVSAAV